MIKLVNWLRFWINNYVSGKSSGSASGSLLGHNSKMGCSEMRYVAYGSCVIAGEKDIGFEVSPEEVTPLGGGLDEQTDALPVSSSSDSLSCSDEVDSPGYAAHILRYSGFLLHLPRWVTEWLSDWVTEWLSDWLSDWVTEWLTEWLSDWSITS